MTLRVLVTRRWPEPAEAFLRDRHDVTFNTEDTPLDAQRLAAALHDYDAILPTVTDRIDAALLAGGPFRTRLICNFGAGVDHIDLARCRELGITVTNTPDAVTEATADIAILLMLSATRRSGEAERMVRAGRWDGWSPTSHLGLDLRGRTLGLVGFGRIAQAVAQKAKAAFGMAIAYHSRNRQPRAVEAAFGAVHHPDLDGLIAASDILSLHCPGGPDTEGLINRERLARMKPSAVLINTARGSVVDDDALIDALKRGVIAAAGLDVYRGEPSLHPGYLDLENAVLLPHLGSATIDTRTAMGMRAAANLDQWAAGEVPRDRIS
ncbi:MULTISPECIES: 2-hydroxyacid dehydrogenase [unclassified Sphingomonas]|uniref:2-hydroxyacid dehydrogenase n=1 Tax=unclassified Sphingomonas TaxID=196159 RepID=UPI0006FBCD30|nr:MULTISPECIES: D-glycerate dehydrogenase [unclassified Sphingomonas]KQX17974.1 D-glycerate dehydrogenase [Sphingomonas sp. Root1294]KQY70899.1 D-glycerate dehydrogenase [Sphingomonas sp. Root50]KRB91607.1 D-glycerate dehydrogenase [Sphingomonas sp. Root720]